MMKSLTKCYDLRPHRDMFMPCSGMDFDEARLDGTTVGQKVIEDLCVTILVSCENLQKMFANY